MSEVEVAIRDARFLVNDWQSASPSMPHEFIVEANRLLRVFISAADHGRCLGEPHVCDQELIAALEGKADRLSLELSEVMPREDEIDSVMSLLNWTRVHHDTDSAARAWLTRVVKLLIERDMKCSARWEHR